MGLNPGYLLKKLLLYLRENLVRSDSVHLVLLFSHTAPHPLEARVLTAPASRKKTGTEVIIKDSSASFF